MQHVNKIVRLDEANLTWIKLGKLLCKFAQINLFGCSSKLLADLCEKVNVLN